MTIFFTSDTHFLHKNILSYESRPFESHEEMTEKMIEVWNEQVSDNDVVYHLGDFAITNFENTVSILKRLKGKIVLIKGNHDRTNYFKKIIKMKLLSEYHEVGKRIKLNGHELWLTHFPMEIGLRPRKWSIHGHIHGLASNWENQVNVGVDSPHFKKEKFGQLIDFEELMAVMDERTPYIEEMFFKRREKRRQKGEAARLLTFDAIRKNI